MAKNFEIIKQLLNKVQRDSTVSLVPTETENEKHKHTLKISQCWIHKKQNEIYIKKNAAFKSLQSDSFWKSP